MREVTPTLEEAYRRHHGMVLGICYKVARNQDDAEDLTQDVFLHLGRQLHKFRGESKFSTWLHRLAFNFCLMKIRGPKAAWRRNMGSLEELSEAANGPALLERALARKDRQLESVVDRRVVHAALARLPASCRLVVELHLQGMEHAEIADVLGIAVGSSKSQLARTKAWLAREVEAPKPAEVEPAAPVDLLDGFDQYL